MMDVGGEGESGTLQALRNPKNTSIGVKKRKLRRGGSREENRGRAKKVISSKTKRVPNRGIYVPKYSL